MRGTAKSLDSLLAETEGKYYSIFSHSFDGILLTGTDGRILAANPAACRMFSRSEEEICRLGRNGIMNLNDHRLARAVEQRALTGTFAGELTGVRSDGTIFPLELSTAEFTDSSGEKLASMIIRDISFRKQYYDELEAAESSLRSILENTDNSIWSVDNNCRFREGNSAFQEKFRSKSGHLIKAGDDFIEWLPEDQRERWRQYMARGLSGASFTTMSLSGIGPDKKYSRLSFNPVRNLSGEVTGLTAMGTDVTDLMMMQKDLVRTGVMLKEAQSVARVGNWEYDVRLNRPDWSDELLRIFGMPRMKGKQSWDSHLKRIHPDDLPRFKEAVIKAWSEGIPFAMVIRLQIPGEDTKWINVICKTETDKHGELTRLYGTVQDVTLQTRIESEREKSEERYRNLFEKSVVPIIEEDFSELKKYFDKLRKRGIKDIRRYFTKHPEQAAQCAKMVKIRDVNTTSVRFFGANHKSELLTDLDVFFTKDSYKIFVEELIALAEGRTEFECDLPVKISGGQERFIQLRVHVVPDSADTLSQVLVSWIDITDRLNFEEELRKSGETLRRLNMHIEEAREKERSEIAMNLHDDLGQKLTALRMNLSWLRRRIGVQSSLVTEKLEEVEQIIDTSVSTVQRISSDLRPALLDHLGLKDAVEWHMKQNLEPAGIKGSFRLADDDLKIDEKTSIVLFRIIQEALTNIIRHSGARRAYVSITRIPSFIELVIKDNGKGINAEAVNDPKSFGITSIKERVKNISGDFKIAGDPGRGTTLTVRVPIIKAQ